MQKSPISQRKTAFLEQTAEEKGFSNLEGGWQINSEKGILKKEST